MKIIPLWDSGKWRHRYLLQFTRGHYVELYTLAWADSLESALDESIDWIAKYAPSLTCNSEVHDEYTRLVADGVPHDLAVEQAEVDTYISESGDYIHADSWNIVFEDPDDDELLGFLGDGLERGALTRTQYEEIEDAIAEKPISGEEK